MEYTIRLYRTLLGNRAHVRSLSEGAAFLAASAIAIFAAATYATVHASNYVTEQPIQKSDPPGATGLRPESDIVGWRNQ